MDEIVIAPKNNVIDISQSKKNAYFYMMLEYQDHYLMLRSNRRTYALDIIGQFDKEQIDPDKAKELLEEGERFFSHTDKMIEKYLKKYGIK